MENKRGKTTDSLLDKPVKFKVRIFGVNIKLGIRPICKGALEMIAKEEEKVIQINDAKNAFEVLSFAKTNTRPIMKIISIACLNNPFKIFLWNRIMSWLLRWSLTPTETNDILNLIIKQSHVTDFFACTVLVKGINPTIKAGQLKEESPLGEKSET